MSIVNVLDEWLFDGAINEIGGVPIESVATTQTVELSAVIAGAVAFAPTVAPGAVTAVAALVSSEAAAYEPTVTPGALTCVADIATASGIAFDQSASPGSVDAVCADAVASGYVPQAGDVTISAITLAADMAVAGTAFFDVVTVPPSQALAADVSFGAFVGYEQTSLAVYAVDASTVVAGAVGESVAVASVSSVAAEAMFVLGVGFSADIGQQQIIAPAQLVASFASFGSVVGELSAWPLLGTTPSVCALVGSRPQHSTMVQTTPQAVIALRSVPRTSNNFATSPQTVEPLDTEPES